MLIAQTLPISRLMAIVFKNYGDFFKSHDVEPKDTRNLFYPLYRVAKERVVKRSDDRVSHPAGYYRQCMSASLLTLPIVIGTALSDPLCRNRQRG